MLQSTSMSFYLTAAIVLYYFAGNQIMSPALSSASLLMKKLAWGIAMPSIVIAGVVNGHVAAKYVWIRCWAKNPQVLSERSFRSRASWIAITVSGWVLAWLIAEAIPSFHLLLALVSALFMGFFSYGFSSLLWFHMNRGSWRNDNQRRAIAVLNIFILLVGLVFICAVGLWATGTKLAAQGRGAVFSCADNASEKIQND